MLMRDSIPIEKCDVISTEDMISWPHLKDLELPVSEAEVELMIGNNVPHALEPWEVINSRREFEPHAIKTKLGWVVCGGSSSGDKINIHRISVKDGRILDKLLIEEYNRDFQDLALKTKEHSVEDRKWLRKAKLGSKKVKDKYEIPLPLLSKIGKLLDTRPTELKRLQVLRRKLLKDK